MNSHVKHFLENKYWKSFYDGCDNQRLRSYYEQSFIFSSTNSEDEERTALLKMHEIEGQFTQEDWQYLIDHTDNKTSQIEYSRKKKRAAERTK